MMQRIARRERHIVPASSNHGDNTLHISQAHAGDCGDGLSGQRRKVVVVKRFTSSSRTGKAASVSVIF